jgi:hypothetical protein
MRNVSNISELDISAINLRALTPEERKAVVREVSRRGYAERARLVHDLTNRLWSCFWSASIGTIAAAARTAKNYRPAREVVRFHRTVCEAGRIWPLNDR